MGIAPGDINPNLADLPGGVAQVKGITQIVSVKVIIPTPREFSFDMNLQFLERSPRELLHRVHEAQVYKLFRFNGETVLVRLTHDDKGLAADFLSGRPSEVTQHYVVNYIREWFDLETDLRPFYKMAKQDALLKDLVKKYYGYRIIGQPDLFESLVWAVLGQQINLGFAYTLKQRFVEAYGDVHVHDGVSYYLFPRPERVTEIPEQALLQLQFSSQKAKYTVGIAKAFAAGEISQEQLRGLPLTEARDHLMKIKGIGNWTANYGLMKTFRYPDAFPLEDAGLHNAIKNLKKMKSKPSLETVKRIFKKYKGWEAYATLYLWKSL